MKCFFTILQISAISLFFSLTSCTKDTPVNIAGNGNETGNALSIYGTLTDSAGNPVSGAVVRAFPVDYVPSFAVAKALDVPNDTSDADGHFKIHTGDTGKFNLECAKEDLGAFIDSILVVDDTVGTHLPDWMLKRLGTITGVSYMAGQDDTTQVRVTIYLPGTRRITKPLIGGRFSFDYIPEGRYQIIFDPTLNTFNALVLDTSLSAGETLDLDTVRMPVFEPDTVVINSGYVYGIWGPNRKYVINDNCIIPTDSALTVLPGTEIIFTRNCELACHNNLFLKGNLEHPITFKHILPSEFWFTLYVGGDTMVISYCIFENLGNGLWFDSLKKVVINNCVFRNSTGVINPYQVSADSFVFFDNVVENNVNNSGYSTLWPAFPSRYKFLANNVFLNNTKPVFLNSGNTIFQYNCYYNCPAMAIPASGSLTVGNVTEDPMFQSTVRGSEDYHLRPGSPCIGAGVNGTDMGIYSTYRGN